MVKQGCAVGVRRICLRRRRVLRVFGRPWAVDMLAEPLSELVCYANWQLSVASRSLGMMLLKVVLLL